MRLGIIIAISVAVAVVAGGVWFNNQSEQAMLEEQRIERAAQLAREEERAREDQAAREKEAAATDQATREAEETESLPFEAAASGNSAAGAAGDKPTVVGDEITEGAIVVESSTAEPIILDADDSATTTRMVDGAETADATADQTSTAANRTDPEQLLTPANFDRDEFLALIDDSEQLTADRRSTLRALVQGASANPAMVEAAVESIRDALELPALN